MNAVIIARIPENMASLKISIPICFSDRGFFAINNLTSVIGAWFSEVVFNFQSSVCEVGFFISRCSTIFLTLDKNKNELIIAGSIAIAAITSTPPTIAIAPYAAPNVIAPESPGNTLLGNL